MTLQKQISLFAFMVGTLIGGLLLITGAPLWSFYLAGFIGGPIVLATDRIARRAAADARGH